MENEGTAISLSNKILEIHYGCLLEAVLFSLGPFQSAEKKISAVLYCPSHFSQTLIKGEHYNLHESNTSNLNPLLS